MTMNCRVLSSTKLMTTERQQGKMLTTGVSKPEIETGTISSLDFLGT